MGSFGDWAGRNGWHHHAESQIENKECVMLVIIVEPNEVILTHDSTLSLDAESKANDEEG